MPSSSSGSYFGGCGAAVRGDGPCLRQFSRRTHCRASRMRVALVLGQVVGEPGRAGVHRRAAQRLVVGDLAGRHLHQRRTGQVDLRPVPNQDRVVGHPRHVRATGRGVAEDHATVGMPRGREPGEVTEHPTTGDEDLRLGGQVRPGRLDQVDHRQPVGQGDLAGPPGLRQRLRVDRAAAYRRVVRDDQALHALDHPDAGDHAGPDREVRAVRGDRRQLQERDCRRPPAARSAPGGAACRGAWCRVTYFSPPPARAWSSAASNSASRSSIAARFATYDGRGRVHRAVQDRS